MAPVMATLAGTVVNLVLGAIVTPSEVYFNALPAIPMAA
jgi:hypothetical protein